LPAFDSNLRPARDRTQSESIGRLYRPEVRMGATGQVPEATQTINIWESCAFEVDAKKLEEGEVESRFRNLSLCGRTQGRRRKDRSTESRMRVFVKPSLEWAPTIKRGRPRRGACSTRVDAGSIGKALRYTIEQTDSKSLYNISRCFNCL
jgi:hypothetical protein